MATKEIKKGCVVYMNADSGMKGYGNPQCVSWVSHEIGELSLYGHNEHYKTYDVREVVEYPVEYTTQQCAAKDAEIERLKGIIMQELELKYYDCDLAVREKLIEKYIHENNL